LKICNIRICNNNCIFCFISQLPSGLRKTLYIKDDDFIQSYSSGNFITLTNLKKNEIDKIIKFRLEPLHVSVHSFDIKIRNKIFGNSENQQAVGFLYDLDRNKIKTNIQIVLCPGLNDGNDLDNTLLRLINDFNYIQSIGIVPVGITKFNKKEELKPFNKKKSMELINQLEDFKNKYKKNKKIKKIFLSDEFYILANYPFPVYDSYGRFYQIQNGIGKSANFLVEIEKFLSKPKNEELFHYRTVDNILVVTSVYGKQVLCDAVKIIKEKFLNKGLVFRNKIELMAIKNEFLGGNVKITGLLSGVDIIFSLQRKNLKKYDKVLIPENIFNSEGFTLDNYKKKDIEKNDKKIKFICENGESFVKEVLKKRI
jgi:putative radical SAM enzyme (TIGR03279 family)